MLKLLTFKLIILLACMHTYAQSSEQTATKGFLIIKSTKKYNNALKKAQVACNDLGLSLNLRRLYQDKTKGLTSNEVCECGEKHGYIPRGRFDDGNYISIEFSTAYKSFKPGYYIIVVASGEKEKLQSILPKVREHYKDAYIKETDIYMGCMH